MDADARAREIVDAWMAAQPYRTGRLAAGSGDALAAAIAAALRAAEADEAERCAEIARVVASDHRETATYAGDKGEQAWHEIESACGETAAEIARRIRARGVATGGGT